MWGESNFLLLPQKIFHRPSAPPLLLLPNCKWLSESGKNNAERLRLWEESLQLCDTKDLRAAAAEAGSHAQMQVLEWQSVLCIILPLIRHAMLSNYAQGQTLFHWPRFYRQTAVLANISAFPPRRERLPGRIARQQMRVKLTLPKKCDFFPPN